MERLLVSPDPGNRDPFRNISFAFWDYIRASKRFDNAISPDSFRGESGPFSWILFYWKGERFAGNGETGRNKPKLRLCFYRFCRSRLLLVFRLIIEPRIRSEGFQRKPEAYNGHYTGVGSRSSFPRNTRFRGISIFNFREHETRSRFAERAARCWINKWSVCITLPGKTLRYN